MYWRDRCNYCTMALLQTLSVVLTFLLPLGHSDFTICKDGWLAFHESCYYFPQNQEMPFIQAVHFCEERGSHLVRIDNPLEMAFIKDFLRGLKAEEHWLGINDINTEGLWVWQDTEDQANVTDWLPGQPGSEAGQEDCAVMAPQYDYRWADLPCTVAREPLCEVMGNYGEPTEIIG